MLSGLDELPRQLNSICYNNQFTSSFSTLYVHLFILLLYSPNVDTRSFLLGGLSIPFRRGLRGDSWSASSRRGGDRSLTRSGRGLVRASAFATALCLTIHGCRSAWTAVILLRGSTCNNRWMKPSASRSTFFQSSAGKQYFPRSTLLWVCSALAPLKGG